MINDELSAEELSTMILSRAKLIEEVQQAVSVNIATAQRKQQENYTKRKGKTERFSRLEVDCAVKMYVPGKRRALARNWEGPYIFKGYARPTEAPDDEAGRKCQLLDADGKLWERARRDVRCFEGELLGGEDAPT